jgi:K(+)-stimulated pyrophosphate-energized sodium pump
VAGGNSTLSRVLAIGFFMAALLFIYRSFYGMRIENEPQAAASRRPVAVKA